MAVKIINNAHINVGLWVALIVFIRPVVVFSIKYSFMSIITIKMKYKHVILLDTFYFEQVK